jgi:hypothetical protein
MTGNKMADADRVELTPEEWEWFKQLARADAVRHVPPAAIRHKLLELKLLEEERGSLFATTQGRDVLKLVDAPWRGGYKWCPPRKV